MAKNDNLTDFLIDLKNTLSQYVYIENQGINPQDFSWMIDKAVQDAIDYACYRCNKYEAASGILQDYCNGERYPQ